MLFVIWGDTVFIYLMIKLFQECGNIFLRKCIQFRIIIMKCIKIAIKVHIDVISLFSI